MLVQWFSRMNEFRRVCVSWLKFGAWLTSCLSLRPVKEVLTAATTISMKHVRCKPRASLCAFPELVPPKTDSLYIMDLATRALAAQVR